MKTSRLVLAIFFVFCIFCFFLLVTTVRSDELNKITKEVKNQPWWPQDADLPELTAFSEVIRDVCVQEFKTPDTKNMFGFGPESVFDQNGKPTHFELVIDLVRDIPKSYIRRQLAYHEVWVKPIDSVMRNIRFLNRSEGRNRDLATNPEKRRGAATMAYHFVDQTAAREAITTALQFDELTDQWEWGTEHSMLNTNATAFVRNFEIAFRDLEQKSQQSQAKLFHLTISFDYVPSRNEIGVVVIENLYADAVKHQIYTGPVITEQKQIAAIAQKTLAAILSNANNLDGSTQRKTSL